MRINMMDSVHEQTGCLPILSLVHLGGNLMQKKWFIRGEWYGPNSDPQTYVWFFGARIQIHRIHFHQDHAKPFNQIGDDEDEEPVEK